MTEKQIHILVTAEKLFAASGFEGTSVRELAKQAGINIAMVSYYFGSKEKLFESLVEYRTGYIREKLETLNRDLAMDPLAKVELAIDIYVERIAAFPHFHKILHHELMLAQRSKMHDSISNILVRNTREMQKLIKEGQNKGIFRKVDDELLVVSIIGTITQCMMSKAMTSKLLKLGNGSILDERPKKRMKTFLKDIVRSYLAVKK